MEGISVGQVLAALLLYAALFATMNITRYRVGSAERMTRMTLGGLWAVTVLGANYLLHLIGLMSYLPWINNGLHTVAWIGVCLSWLYMAVRSHHGMVFQCVVFFTFSLVVKYGEQIIFGTWEHGHFFWLFESNHAYVIGWSILDGLYPVISLYGLRLLSKFIPGLVTT